MGDREWVDGIKEIRPAERATCVPNWAKVCA